METGNQRAYFCRNLAGTRLFPLELRASLLRRVETRQLPVRTHQPEKVRQLAKMCGWLL